jgi:hypothetical protein
MLMLIMPQQLSSINHSVSLSGGAMCSIETNF